MGIIYIIGGLLSVIGVLWLLNAKNKAKKEKAEEREKSAIDAKAQSDIVITEQIRRRTQAINAAQAQNNKRRTDQQHSDEGIRDAFEKDSF